MPKIMNGHKASPEVSPDYELTAKLLKEFQATWNEQYKEAGVDPVLFSRLSIVALSQLAAVVAVDVGMNIDQFMAVCRALHVKAFDAAPKFS